MRKRSGRPPKFAAVPNDTVDDSANLDLIALGLLTVLLRHKDGWDITLADIGRRYGLGEDALAGAMGLLQVARYVIKIRVMGNRGHWSTEVVVYDSPADDQEIGDLLDSILEEDGVRQVQLIQPTKSAYDRVKKRTEKLEEKNRLRGTAESVATCENAGTDSGVHRESVEPRVIKKTVSKKTKNPGSFASAQEPAGEGQQESLLGDGTPSAADQKKPRTRKPKERTPEEQTRFDVADAIANAWWARCEELNIPNLKRGTTSGFVGFRSMLERALAADCTEVELKWALEDLRDPFPSINRLQQAIARRRGVAPTPAHGRQVSNRHLQVIPGDGEQATQQQERREMFG